MCRFLLLHHLESYCPLKFYGGSEMASGEKEGGGTSVMVAVSKHSSSVSALKWALSNKVVGQAGSTLRLVHIRSPLRSIPTPSGNFVPIDKVSPDMVATYKRDLQSKTEQCLQAHRKLCEAWKVQAELVIVENDDVVNSLLDQLSRFRVNKFIIGTSNNSVFIRKLKGPNMPEIIAKRASESCTVFLISKGKLVSVREARQSLYSSGFSTKISQIDCAFSDASSGMFSGSDSSGGSYTALKANDEHTKKKLIRYDSTPSQQRENTGAPAQPLWSQREKAVSRINLWRGRSVNTGSIQRTLPPGCHVFYSPFWSRNTPLRDEDPELPWQPNRTSTRRIKKELLSDDVNGADSSGKKQPGRCNEEETICEEAAGPGIATCEGSRAGIVTSVMTSLPSDTSAGVQENTTLPATKLSANKKDHVYVVEHADTEDIGKKLNEALTEGISIEGKSKTRYREYSFEELKVATDGFSEANQIGLGGYGPVYKGRLHHTSVAIKVLNKESVQGPKEFQRELEFLSRMHHPHIVLLLGACPEKGCLVYEYLANGSLEDRLLCKGNTVPLAWHTRFRIAAEVATALLFLHSWKPSPYVHRDLKPANILLDRNSTSKLGDVGLATLAPPNFSYSVTEYIETRPVGTFAYIDPEYQRTGAFTPRSDVYAFGLIMLQLLTGKGPLGLTAIIEVALNEKTLPQVLDPTAGHWPVHEATELAILALKCSEMKRRSRLDMDAVLPLLENLRAFADDYVAGMAPCIQDICVKEQGVPNYFFCPISKEVMEEPHIAADGFTYEYAAMRQWLQNHKTSPVTNQKLRHKQLIPNHSLRLAIHEWKQVVRDA